MNNEKSCASTSINWYPGHMAKTKKQIQEDLKLVDVVVEILDARVPLSSQNPDIEKIIANKKRVLVLNKSDLAEENQNKIWQNFFSQKGISTLIANANTGEGTASLIKEVKNVIKEDLEKQEQKGRINKNVRIMIIRDSQCRQIFFYK